MLLAHINLLQSADITFYKGLNIFQAAQQGNLEVLQHLVENQQISINAIDKSDGNIYKDPISYAIEYDHLPIVKYCISKGASPNGQGGKRDSVTGTMAPAEQIWTPLQTAAFYGKIDILTYLLLTCKADVNKEKGMYIAEDNSISYQNNLSALWVALYKKNIAIIRFLAEHGADVISCIKEPQSLDIFKILIKYVPENYDFLKLAASYARTNPEICMYIITTKKININATVKGNEFTPDTTLLNIASTNNNGELVTFLLNNGAQNLTSALLAATNYEDANWGIFKPLKSCNLDVIKILVEHGADVTINNSEALQRAARYRYLDVIEYLVHKGADVHKAQALFYASGKGPYISPYSASHNFEGVFSYLLLQNPTQEEKNIAFINALQQPECSVQALEILYQSGITNLNTKSTISHFNRHERAITSETTPLQLAITIKKPLEYIRFLIMQAHADPTIPASDGSTTYVTDFLKERETKYGDVADIINYINEHYQLNITAIPTYNGLNIFQAIEQNRLDAVQHLIEVDHVDVNQINMTLKATPLYMAITKNYFPIVKYLIEHGANVSKRALVEGNNSKEPYLPSAVSQAILENKIDILKYLVENYKIDLNQTYYSKYSWPEYTPLELAIIIDKIELVKYLIRPDSNLKNAFATAFNYRAWDIIQYILSLNYAPTPEAATDLLYTGILYEMKYIELCITYKANPNVLILKKYTPAMILILSLHTNSEIYISHTSWTLYSILKGNYGKNLATPDTVLAKLRYLIFNAHADISITIAGTQINPVVNFLKERQKQHGDVADIIRYLQQHQNIIFSDINLPEEKQPEPKDTQPQVPSNPITNAVKNAQNNLQQQAQQIITQAKNNAQTIQEKIAPAAQNIVNRGKQALTKIQNKAQQILPTH